MEVNDSRCTSHSSASTSGSTKGKKNKRKFRADPPSSDLNNNTLNDHHPGSADNVEVSRLLDQQNASDLCSVYPKNPDGMQVENGAVNPPDSSATEPPCLDDRLEFAGFQYADWDEVTEAELEELCLRNLDAIFKSVIRKIMSCGYSKEVATRALLQSCIWHVSNDTVSNVFESTLDFLKTGEDDDSLRMHCFETLRQLEKYILSELVCAVREVRPFFSAGDALWSLLLCDMNVIHACSVETNVFATFSSDRKSGFADRSPSENEGLSSADDKHASRKGKRDAHKKKPAHLETSISRKGLIKARDSTGVGANNARLRLIKKETFCSASPSSSLLADVEHSLRLAASIDLNRNDERVMRLIPVIRELQNQIYEWTEWANQKVMQAARGLSKNHAELKLLKQEYEEAERFVKEKQTLEDNTMRKISKMENALYKASEDVEKADSELRRLEDENIALLDEMGAAKLSAAESAESCREAELREKKAAMELKFWEKQKTQMQEELALEKRNAHRLLQDLNAAKQQLDQQEARWKNEEEEKEELLRRAAAFRKEREEIEASSRRKEDAMEEEAEANLKSLKSDIERMERDISRLRLAAMRRRFGVEADKGVKRERECVMCLSEEMSVLFVPCAHQVLCGTCNEIHQKSGMHECPSCRAAIHRRVVVRYSDT